MVKHPGEYNSSVKTDTFRSLTIAEKMQGHALLAIITFNSNGQKESLA